MLGSKKMLGKVIKHIIKQGKVKGRKKSARTLPFDC